MAPAGTAAAETAPVSTPMAAQQADITEHLPLGHVPSPLGHVPSPLSRRESAVQAVAEGSEAHSTAPGRVETHQAMQPGAEPDIHRHAGQTQALSADGAEAAKIPAAARDAMSAVSELPKQQAPAAAGASTHSDEEAEGSQDNVTSSTAQKTAAISAIKEGLSADSDAPKQAVTASRVAPVVEAVAQLTVEKFTPATQPPAVDGAEALAQPSEEEPTQPTLPQTANAAEPIAYVSQDEAPPPNLVDATEKSAQRSEGNCTLPEPDLAEITSHRIELAASPETLRDGSRKRDRPTDLEKLEEAEKASRGPPAQQGDPAAPLRSGEEESAGDDLAVSAEGEPCLLAASHVDQHPAAGGMQARIMSCTSCSLAST